MASIPIKESIETAQKRFHDLDSRLQKNVYLRDLNTKFMLEHIELGSMIIMDVKPGSHVKYISYLTIVFSRKQAPLSNLELFSTALFLHRIRPKISSDELCKHFRTSTRTHAKHSHI